MLWMRSGKEAGTGAERAESQRSRGADDQRGGWALHLNSDRCRRNHPMPHLGILNLHRQPGGRCRVRTQYKLFCFEHPDRDLDLGAPGSLWGWALQGISGVWHFRESLVESLWGWALQGVSRGRPGEEKSSGRGEELSLKSNNPTPKVWNKKNAEQSIHIYIYRNVHIH